MCGKTERQPEIAQIMNCKARNAAPSAASSLVKTLLLLSFCCSCHLAANANLDRRSQKNPSNAGMNEAKLLNPPYAGSAQTGNGSPMVSASNSANNSNNAYNVSADVILIAVTTDTSGNDSLSSADNQAVTTSVTVALVEDPPKASNFLKKLPTKASGCPPGYQLASGGVCADVDECLNFTEKRTEQEEDRRDVCGNYIHSHRPGYRCVNTPGSYRCERLVDCGFGYVLNDTTGDCIDIDECAVLGYQTACGTTLPIKVCINLDGSFRCEYRSCPSGEHLDRVTGECKQCPRGFAKEARSGGSCVDVNECERRSLNNCPPHMRCANYVGGYECKHKIFCSMGRRANYNGTRCIDIDECTEQPGICGLGHNCVNTDGSYQCESKQCGKLQRLNLDSGACVCIDGFRMNATSRVCEDINECSEGRHNCDVNDVCRNTRGHFDCLSRDKVCEPGFGLSFDTSTCVDIDECKLGQFKCGQNEFCNNTYGSYTCLCHNGFQRQGSDRACTDTDECAAPVSPCPAPLLCANSVGSFACRCPAGFRAAHPADPRRCLDVDECQEVPGICGNSSGRCLNSPPGAYSCQCSPGYMANETVGGTCVDIDECKLRACPARAACSNSPGGYDCNCGGGFKFVRGSNECEDIDECDQATSVCQPSQSCFNYRGSHACYRHSCPQGFLASSTVQKGLNSLSFSCQSANASCQLVASLNGSNGNHSAPSRPLCVSRHRTVHKAQEVANPASGSSASGDPSVTIQSDMRQDDRVCEFRATVTRRDNSSETVYHRDALPQSASSALQFQHRKLGKFTICSTKLKLSACTVPNRVVKVQLLVALVGRRSAEMSDNTIHIVQT